MLAVTDSLLQPILALLGQPIAANPSQYMIEKAFAHHELDWRYLTVEVAPERLEDAVRGMRAMGFAGGNLAEPHKEAVLAHLDRLTPAAELCGVVNSIRRDDDALLGDNTEGRALVAALKPTIELEGARAVVLGTGKMARASVAALAAAGVGDFTLLGRDEGRVRAMAEHFSGKIEATITPVVWHDPFGLPPESNVVVNATPIGRGDPEAKVPLVPETLLPEMTVVDVTVNPPETRLLREASERGCHTVDGLAIFIGHTAIDFALWTGVEPDRTVLREAVEEFLEL
jgi:shikimate dehydrogenase